MARQRRQAAVTGLVLFVASAVIAACGGEREPEPDRVVNVVLRCEQRASTFDGVYHPPRPFTGTECERRISAGVEAGGTPEQVYSVWNMRQEVTVRTASGGAYTIEVSPATPVAVGNQWPPSQ